MTLDLLALTLLALLLLRGSTRGFFLSLAGPASFLLASALAFAYFNMTKDIKVTFVIALAGPFVLYWLMALVLRSFNLAPASNAAPSALSATAGAVVTAAWGMSFVVPVIFALMLLPRGVPQLDMVQDYVKNTWTYRLCAPVVRIFPLFPATKAVSGAAAAHGTKTAPAGTLSPAMQDISEDPRMKALLKDPAVAKAVEDHNYGVLLANPKFQELLQDPAFIKKALVAYGQMK